MSLYLLSLPDTAAYSVCELTEADATAIRARLAAAGAFESADDIEPALFEPLVPDDRATVEAIIDLWEGARP